MLSRPRLERELADAAHRRLTSVVAGPGLGKTTLLGQWGRSHGWAWYTVDAADREPAVLARRLLEAARVRVPGLDAGAVEPPSPGPALTIPSEGQSSLAADQLMGVLTERLDEDLVLVVDDVQALTGAEASCQLLGELVRGSPSQLHVVLSTRDDVPFPVARLRAQGLTLDLSGERLRFTEAETAALITGLLGPHAEAEVAAVLHRHTAGWPAGVRLVAESLRAAPGDRWGDRVAQAADPGGPLEGFLVEDVLPATPEEVLDLLRALVSLDRFTPPLVAELVGPGADELVRTLVRGGLWVVADRERDGWYVVPPLLCRFLRSRLAVDADDRAIVTRRAAAWMEGKGETHGALARLLAADPVATAHEAGSRVVRGDYDGALALLRPELERDGPVPMATGLLAGLAHHFKGELEEASALYERALAGPGNDVLRAMTLGWAATAAWLRGDVDPCRRLAAEAEEAATRSGDARALAMAYTAMALVAAIEGDRQAMRLYGRALEFAEAAHDHVQIVRLRNNRGSRLMGEGYYPEALVELDEAVRLADLAGIGMLRPTALSNRGETLIGLGRLDEAARELEAAKAHYEHRGSRMASYPLAHLGTVHRLQGHLTLARAHYEESIAIAEASGLHQGLVPALAGLARVVAETDPEEAARLAERAVSATSLARPEALTAAADVALRAGDLERAAAHAAEAGEAARARRDRPALAEALLVQARVLGERGDAGEAARLLEEAAAIWSAIGNPLGEARVCLARARLGGPNAEDAAAEAERIFRRLGARTLAGEAAQVQADLARAARPALAIRVLGGFAVERGGVPVTAGEWQSRKARDLLKVMISRRGRPVTREALIELLWPDEDPSRAGSRLSVTLSTLRSVLDPGKQFDPEHFVANDRAAAWLRLDHVAVDIEVFLAQAEAGRRALAEGDVVRAAELLAAADAAYAGDFLEEDPYEDWATVLREEARATYVSVAMALAELARAGGDFDGAGRYLLRVLARDPYDERAHLQLVAALSGAGRHGEARRMYRAYCDRMADIDVEPAAFPAIRR